MSKLPDGEDIVDYTLLLITIILILPTIMLYPTTQMYLN